MEQKKAQPLFGPSGNDELFYEQGGKSSVEAPAWLAAMGLTAYEINCGRGVKMGEKMALELGAEAKKYNIQVSVHAPYYINLGSADPEIVKKSLEYIERCIKLLQQTGGKRLVVHVGSQGNLERGEAIANIKNNLKWVFAELDAKGLGDFLMCIETMGRFRAIGNYIEICDICAVDKRLIPTLDFGHVNCLLQGELQREPAKYAGILGYVEKQIGAEKFKKLHIHFSAVIFNEKGEQAHSTLDNVKWTIPFEPLARLIKQKNISPTIICESEGIMAQDAKRLKTIWLGI